MDVKKYNQLFEATLRGNEGTPNEYLDKVERIARQQFGTHGPNEREHREGFETFMQIQRIQQGQGVLDILTKIGKDIIMEFYGSILDGVELDIKIVPPNDREKREMAMAAGGGDDEDEDEETDNTPAPKSEVDKRKILNNIMQGEAQNVQNMILFKKDEIDRINPRLADLYLRGFEINKKFDWMQGINLEQAMGNNPDMANMVKVDWKKKGDKLTEANAQDEETYPVIKVRAMDLIMLIHETVKGIYELIMANAIPADPKLARKIHAETDSLKNEQEDVKYGPFIAADVRDYVNDLIKRKVDSSRISNNLREFIYARMSMLPAEIFTELIKNILLNNIVKADAIMVNREHDVLNSAVSDALGEVDDSYSEEEPLDFYEKTGKETSPKDIYSTMSKSQLGLELDKSLDANDYEKVNKINSYLTPGTKKVAAFNDFGDKPTKTETSYDKMTKVELQNELDKALDNYDFEKVTMINNILKNK
jgi:hypothetical protein